MIHVDFEQRCARNKNWKWDTVSHLFCDPGDDLNSLHRFAQSLGLKRAWFQPLGGGVLPHYDLTPGMRLKAVKSGANEILTREGIVAKLKEWRVFVAAEKAKPVQSEFF